MVRNYFTIALRNFRRQKGFAFINILGLAVGLASATFIFLYIFNELTYDRFHPEADNLYVLGTHAKFQGGEQTFPEAPGAWVKALKDGYPEVTDGTQTFWAGFPLGRLSRLLPGPDHGQNHSDGKGIVGFTQLRPVLLFPAHQRRSGIGIFHAQFHGAECFYHQALFR
jgi:hypothetical protein